MPSLCCVWLVLDNVRWQRPHWRVPAERADLAYKHQRFYLDPDQALRHCQRMSIALASVR